MTELDIEQSDALLTYLEERGSIQAGERPDIALLKGGVSNRVVRLKRSTGEGIVLKQALPKLRVQVDWFSSPNRVHREALALGWMRELGLSVPALRFEDETHHILAMDAIPESNENWKTMLLAGRVSMMHIDAFAETLVTMHAKSSSDRKRLNRDFGNLEHFESLRIEPYFVYTSNQVPEARRFMSAVIDATRVNRICLVHGDYSPKNILASSEAIVLLDHEAAHFGDPAFDLGFSMTHLLSKAHHLVDNRDSFHAATIRYWDRYWDSVGTEPWADRLEGRAVAATLACLLARVEGRSPLEYLDARERVHQRGIVLSLMARPPVRVHDLVDSFLGAL
jgi:5-methylthioribose kinase